MARKEGCIPTNLPGVLVPLVENFERLGRAIYFQSRNPLPIYVTTITCCTIAGGSNTTHIFTVKKILSEPCASGLPDSVGV